VNLDTQIPKKGDQRQMEAWQRIGTYAAGLALDSAGVKGNKEILARMDMIVAAGGGERDLAVDCSILTAEAKGNAAPGFLNERLMNDLRPTAVPGAAFEPAGRQHRHRARRHRLRRAPSWARKPPASIAARIALAGSRPPERHRADRRLANGERKDLLVLYEFDNFNLRDKFAPVWAREKNAGFALGSAGAFLVIESRAHAEARGAKPYARLTNVVADLSLRKHPGDVDRDTGKIMVEAWQA